MVPRLGIVLGLLLIAGLFHLVAFPASYKRNVRNPRIWRGILDEQMGRIKRITTGDNLKGDFNISAESEKGDKPYVAALELEEGGMQSGEGSRGVGGLGSKGVGKGVVLSAQGRSGRGAQEDTTQGNRTGHGLQEQEKQGVWAGRDSVAGNSDEQGAGVGMDAELNPPSPMSVHSGNSEGGETSVVGSGNQKGEDDNHDFEGKGKSQSAVPPASDLRAVDAPEGDKKKDVVKELPLSQPPAKIYEPQFVPSKLQVQGTQEIASGAGFFDAGQEHNAQNGQHWEISRNPNSLFSFNSLPKSRNVSWTPRIFHFVWVSKGLREPYEVPSDLEDVVKQWITMNPGWKATIWTNTLIREHFPRLAAELLARLDYPAWIADLSRYAILTKYGGMYIDADTFPVHPLDDLVTQHSPFTVCQGYDDDKGSAIVPYSDRLKCRRFANGIIAVPPNETVMITMRDSAVDRSITMGLGQQEEHGSEGKNKKGFHIGLTGPYLWKTMVLRQPSWTILSMKTFLPCGWRNPAKMSHCKVSAYIEDHNVYGMHKLTWT